MSINYEKLKPGDIVQGRKGDQRLITGCAWYVTYHSRKTPSDPWRKVTGRCSLGTLREWGDKIIAPAAGSLEGGAR